MNLSRREAQVAEAFFLTNSRSSAAIRKAKAEATKKLEKLARTDPNRILALAPRSIPTDAIDLLEHLQRLASDTIQNAWVHARQLAEEEPEVILNPVLRSEFDLNLDWFSLKEREHLEIIAMKASASH